MTVIDPELDKEIAARLKELPKVVRDAIESSAIQKHLRDLANNHKLHLDQWTKLENEVMLALLGLEPVEDLQKNIQSEIGVSTEVATELSADISRIVFEPIRQELERELEHPDARAKVASAVEEAGQQALARGTRDEGRGTTVQGQGTRDEGLEAAGSSLSRRQAPTPTSAPTTVKQTEAPAKAVSAPLSSTYKSGEPSAIRKNVHDDPYRESPA